MKVTIGIATRGRPLNLIGVVASLYRLRSQNHEVDFVIGADSDDVETLEIEDRLSRDFPCRWTIDQPPLTLGAAVNRVYAEAGPECLFGWVTDRTFPVTPGWDDGLVQAMHQHPKRLIWWTCSFYDGVTLPNFPPVLKRAWERPWPEIFSYWFDDNWVEEVDVFAHGFPRLFSSVTYSGERWATQRFREYGFWAEVFSKTRAQRISQARSLCEALDVPFSERPEVLEYFEKRDRLWLDNAPEMEAAKAECSEPSARYLLAKQNAIRLIERKEAA